MRIDYRILWIEDTPEWLDSIIGDVRLYLEDMGFSLFYDRIDKYEPRNFLQYDLIAIDLELEEDESGADAIELIRDGNNFYTEILFYSQSGERSLREKILGKSVDGVYCSDRRDFLEKIKKLIDTTVRKTQEVNNLRGLVMAEEAELQKLMREILWKIHEDNHSLADFIRKHGYAKTGEHLNSTLELLAEIQKEKDYEKFFNLPQYGAFGKQMTLSAFLNEVKKTNVAFNPLVDVMKKYDAEIIQPRNNLAHSTEEETGGKIMLVNNQKGTKIEFTSDECVKIRKDIKKHKKNLNEIFKLIENG